LGAGNEWDDDGSVEAAELDGVYIEDEVENDTFDVAVVNSPSSMFRPEDENDLRVFQVMVVVVVMAAAVLNNVFVIMMIMMILDDND
jgi:hypothetical protein